jgi:hypothetical protein
MVTLIVSFGTKAGPVAAGLESETLTEGTGDFMGDLSVDMMEAMREITINQGGESERHRRRHLRDLSCGVVRDQKGVGCHGEVRSID